MNNVLVLVGTFRVHPITSTAPDQYTRHIKTPIVQYASEKEAARIMLLEKQYKFIFAVNTSYRLRHRYLLLTKI
jgi:hypothetical protein